MKAMILAAGMGTRLRPLTDTTPKALIPVNGKPLLQHVIEKLKALGIVEIIVNVHHLAEQVVRFIEENHSFGIRVEISHEDTILDTGGGLQKAAWFFDDGQPFLLHNVDILTNVNIPEMLAWHKQKQALVTLAVRKRQTSRYFLFDRQNRLCGWESLKDNEKKIIVPQDGDLQRFSFMGVHLISPHLFSLLKTKGAFSIVPAYLELAGQGEKIFGYPANHCKWMDVGRPETLKQASGFLTNQRDHSSHGG